MDHKFTLNLPQTAFPMKADLATREPQRLEKWQAEGLYEKIQAARAAAKETFVLHDGPPFANGDVHVGTALNKILKDIIVKYHTLRGRRAPYIPGWDCHGLPIEFKVTQDLRKAGDTNSDPAAIRKACDAYARKFIDIQRTQFKRLGVLGDWENPYLTLNQEYEADELRLFADIVEKGFVYRGKKPVYWSIPCRTALAEAEVEYHDHVSQSVYVKFRLVPATYEFNYTQEDFGLIGGKLQSIEGESVVEKVNVSDNWFVIIWTTTPWTLPANMAVAANTTLDYSVVQVENENYLIAADLVPVVSEKCQWQDFKIVQTIPGTSIVGLDYFHPFIKRTSRILIGDAFVEHSTGTGFVHIAPGHGLEDYNLGRLENLPIYSPVDDDGCLTHTSDLPVDAQMPIEMTGKSILEKHGKSEANEAVLHELRARHALLHQENYHHSYPFCWRSKTPVIFRAMDQWFIRIDAPLVFSDDKSLQKSFRQKALEEIGRVTWVPDWGVNRIRSAVESRPDWCISRQRSWGVPIPAFYDANREAILDAHVVRRVADLIEQRGSNVWFEKSAAELWALVKPADWNGPDAVMKSSDTLDVWIDSGSSSRAVLMRRKELQQRQDGAQHVVDFSARTLEKFDSPAWRADMYLEGSDQHRGWFQSSLLLSLAGNGAAPFKTVLTHGFMVDADREKISKSKQGAYEKPQTSEAYVKKYGADVLRLWVASQDYRSDIVVSEERINKVSETYRAIRNTLRYQLSNLFDFDPAKHTVPDEQLTGLDRWILGEFAALEQEIMAAYDAYEFHVVYQKLSQFIAVQLSSVYHDVVKDRLYTDPADSQRRRSTQTALHRMVKSLCQMLAPILAFTADESWEYVPGTGGISVHASVWAPKEFARGEEEKAVWVKFFHAREAALPHLEQARQAKTIGKALDAKLGLTFAADAPAKVAAPDRDTLRELLNVSQLEFLQLPAGLNPTGGCAIEVHKADGQKCERCWHWEMDVGANSEFPLICARCAAAEARNRALRANG